MGILIILFTWLIGAAFLFGVIYYAVRMGIDHSWTSFYVKKIHSSIEEKNNNDH